MKHIPFAPKKAMPAALAVALTLTACNTDADLCYDTIHPHAASLTFGFSFESGVDAPDTMLVIANRVVARRISAINVCPETGYGRFVVGEMDLPSEPETGDDASDAGDSDENNTETGETDGDDSAAEESDAGETRAEEGEEATAESGQMSTFNLPVGDYRFLAFNMDTEKYDYTNVETFLAGDEYVPMDEIYVDYRVFTRTSPELGRPVVDWQDYNPYAGYMQPDIPAIVVDTMRAELQRGSSQKITMHPIGQSQNIDIYFNVTKDISKQNFVVDSVLAEVSGIPRRMTLVNGNLDVSNTAKMMFWTELVDASGNPKSDTETATSVRCHANIDVTGIVPGQNSTLTTGPGIMQVILYVSTVNPEDPTGERLRKKIQGIINIYNTLTNANLMEYVEDGKYARRATAHGVLNIVANLAIDGESILTSSDNDYGVDAWQQADDDIFVDI